MKVAFLTESGFSGKVPDIHPNMRTEMAWMCALEANHYYIGNFQLVSGYDYVFVIFPKGGTSISSEGEQLIDRSNRFEGLYSNDIVKNLQSRNSKVCFIQEGPTWFMNDYSIIDQFNYYNQVASCDLIFSHNEWDTKWYKGMFPGKPVHVIPTLMIETLIKDIIPNPKNKVMIGGNFCRWYGGFQSYVVADEFECEKWIPSMHNKRINEESITDLNHLEYKTWIDWIKNLSTFKYGIHLMPTIAAGTFSLNCAFLGIPCIGNNKVDTQLKCFPYTAVDPEDIEGARILAQQLKVPTFYTKVSEYAKEEYRRSFHVDVWKRKMFNILK